MLDGYFYKLLDRWTPPIGYLPRWFTANGYPTLSDLVEPPTSAPDGGPISIVDPSGGKIPASWTHSDGTPEADPSLLQSLFEGFVNEKEYLSPWVVKCLLQSTLNYDVADPDYGWVIESREDVEKVEILNSSNAWETIPRATSELDLFSSGGRRWMQDGRCLLILGLEIVQTVTKKDTAGWQFMHDYWSEGSPVWVAHPSSKNWFPIHPAFIRKDGFIGLNFPASTCSVRVRYSSAIQYMEEMRLRVNGQEKTARRVQLRTSLDDAGIWCRIDRREGEINNTYAFYLQWSNWFARGQDKESTRNFISIALRTCTVQTVNKDATGFTYPSGAKGFSIKEMERFGYVTEGPISRNVSDKSTFRTLLANPSQGLAFLRQRPVTITQNASGTYSLDTPVADNRLEAPVVLWKAEFWTVAGSSVTFTQNFARPAENMTVLFPMKVDVVDPSEATLKSSFNRTFPAFRWQSRPDALDDADRIVRGLAVFD